MTENVAVKHEVTREVRETHTDHDRASLWDADHVLQSVRMNALAIDLHDFKRVDMDVKWVDGMRNAPIDQCPFLDRVDGRGHIDAAGVEHLVVDLQLRHGG